MIKLMTEEDLRNEDFRERLEKWLKSIAERGEKWGLYTVSSLIQSLQTGNELLWGVWKDDDLTGVLVTEIVQYPEAKALRVNAVAGEKVIKEGGAETLAELEKFGRNMGCKVMDAWGRPGFARWLKNTSGYEIYQVNCLKNIEA